jgi:hypothetical protein
MSVTIVRNLGAPQFARPVEAAVRKAIAEAPGDWNVWIEESQNKAAWTIRVEGPAGFRWKCEFFGPEEQTPAFIGAAIKQVVTGYRSTQPLSA